ncbi:MAG: ketopantoate reductase family protein, partial [Oscillospiraceae bacterium]|nr:ketopantoate reductase family protein [Oscillospiraceae bacterium]
YDTYVYARGGRLTSLKKYGLLYIKNKRIRKANVNIVEKVEAGDIYDFVFLTVRENQVHTALAELRENKSANIVTMVNTVETYESWEKICGKGRIIPAFPGAGGSFESNVLKAALTPKIIQPTTFGEINGNKASEITILADIFRNAGIPYQIVKNMHNWQLCHLAMVVPIADAYYEADNPEKAGNEMDLMYRTAQRIKRNFRILHRIGIEICPPKMNFFRIVPTAVLCAGLSLVFKSNFGKIFMYSHSMNAPGEMRRLHRQFYSFIRRGRFM